MSTVQKIIDGGYAKSAAARPETMTATGELVTRIGLCLREVFQILGRESPTIIGSSANVTFTATGWARPANCLRALKAYATISTLATPTINPGDEINVVPWNDKLFMAGEPSLYEFGQAFFPVGQSIDPRGGDILLEFARAPQVPANVGDSIDSLFPEFFDDILECDIASFLAVKDQRDEDSAAFSGLKNAGILQLIDWSRGQTYGLKQRFPLTTPPLTNTDGGRQAPLSPR